MAHPPGQYGHVGKALIAVVQQRVSALFQRDRRAVGAVRALQSTAGRHAAGIIMAQGPPGPVRGSRRRNNFHDS